MSNVDWIIDVSHLQKSFNQKPAIVDLSLQVRHGDIFAFLGPNGAGKTTTIRMLCGLLLPDGGKGTCMGYDIFTEGYKIRSQIGYMAQYFSLYNDLTVYENLALRARIYGIQNAKSRIEKCLEQLNLVERQKQYPKNLSGGWRQRLALAAAVLHQPLLLLLDEPTAGVDPKSRRDFWSLIHQMSDAGTTILLSTHYMDEAEYCKRIAYTALGRIIVHGTLPEIGETIKLTTWSVEGPNLNLLSKQLENLTAVQIITASTYELRVSSNNPQELAETLAPFQEHANYTWTLVKPRLEDMFLWLTKIRIEPNYVS